MWCCAAQHALSFNSVQRCGGDGPAGRGGPGLVVRPLVGVSGGVTRFLEGVSNTATLFDKEASKSVRSHPRAFYGQGRVMRQYKPGDALVASILRKLDSKQVCTCR